MQQKISNEEQPRFGMGRILGLGAELPPNSLMRYGLMDIRNYDSVELARSLAWFSPLYGPGPGARSSRRTATWAGVIRARDRLEAAGVVAVVGPTPPPPGAFSRADRVGEVWVARLAGAGLARLESGRGIARVASRDHGEQAQRGAGVLA